MAANEAVDALQDELVALTCEEQKPTTFARLLPRSVFIALAQRYLTATQRAALAASDKYAREELVTNGDLAPSVWRATWISQTAAVRMLSTVPPRAYAPLQWTSELVIIDSDTRGVAASQINRYWKGLSLLVANAPALTVLRMRKPWRLSPLVFAAVARRPAMRLEVATLTPERLDDLGVDARQLVREERLTCPKLVCGGPWPLNGTWLDLLKQATLVELDLSDNRALVELPEAIATLQSLRVLRANRLFNLRRIAVLARGPPALEVLALNQNQFIQFPAQLACASSLVRLEIYGSSLLGKTIANGARYELGKILDIVERLPQLRRLSITGELYENYFSSVEIDQHPCFVPSALEFLGELGIFSRYREHWIRVLREPILDAVPCRKKDLELALATAELTLRETDARQLQSREVTPEAVRSMEVMEDFLACLRAALAGKPYPVEPPSPTASRVDDTAQVAAMNGDALAAANAAFAAVAAERDRLAAAAPPRFAFRAPSPVAALRVTPSRPSFFSASVAEPRVTSDKPFVFGAKPL